MRRRGKLRGMRGGVAEDVYRVVNGPLHAYALPRRALAAVEGAAIRVGLRLPEGLPLGEERPDRLALSQVPVFVVTPLAEDVRTRREPVLARDDLRGHAVLVWAVGVRAIQEQGEHEIRVPVSSGEMERRRSRGARDGEWRGSGAMSVVRVPPRESGE